VDWRDNRQQPVVDIRGGASKGSSAEKKEGIRGAAIAEDAFPRIVIYAEGG